MRSRSCFAAAFAGALAISACADKSAPGASPNASGNASGSASASASQRTALPPKPRPTSSEAPKPPPSGSAKADEDAPDPVLSFAGFSKDGKRFAYASGSASGAPMTFLWVTEPGSTGAKVAMSVDLDYRGALGEAREFLEKEGFVGDRRPPPPELKMKADLTATPPTVTLELEGRKKKSEVGTAPHPDTDTDKATAWGLSPDGTHLAIRIQGPAVTKSGAPSGSARMVTFYRVVPMP